MTEAKRPSDEALARRKLFVAALRSGEFPQGKGALATQRKDGVWEFCCLGVACEVASRNGLETPYEVGHRHGDLARRYYTYQHAQFVEGAMDDGYVTSSILPLYIQKWYEFGSGDPDLVVAPLHDSEGPLEVPAAEANDTYGRDFAEIADAFENDYILPWEPVEETPQS